MKLYIALIDKYFEITLEVRECDITDEKFVPVEDIGVTFPTEHENTQSHSNLIDRCLVYTTDSSKFKTLAMALLNDYKKLVGVDTGKVITESENTINKFEV